MCVYVHMYVRAYVHAFVCADIIIIFICPISYSMRQIIKPVCICGGVMFGERLWKKTDRHVNWTGRMPWIMVDGASGQEMTDDHDGCV